MPNLTDLREIEGYFFDETTGKLYDDLARDTGSTFEDCRSTIVGLQWLGFFYRLNPLNFATQDTAMRVLDFCKSIAAGNQHIVHIEMLENRSGMDGWVKRNKPERVIIVTNGVREESFSCGRLAMAAVRNGADWARKSFAAELKQAGF